MKTTFPIACDLSAIPAAERAQHQAVNELWRSRIEQTVDLSDGYAYRFTSDGGILLTLAQFISRERLCCPFFRFQIDLEPGGPLWLRLTGPEGAKALLGEFFGAD